MTHYTKFAKQTWYNTINTAGKAEWYLMRGLNTQFMRDLTEGELKDYLDLIRNDGTLELEIRDNCVYIFYRGSALYIISHNNRGYEFKNNHIESVTEKFRGGYWAREAVSLYREKRFFDAIPFLKSLIDRHISEVKPMDEKEIHQLIVRENNRMSAALNTDYYFIGFEYRLPLNKSSDLAAVRYKTTSRSRTIAQLALVEVKFNTDAFSNNSGIAEHITDAERFFSNEECVSAFKQETIKVFQQKHELGLINSAKAIEQIDNGKPEFILALADATPNGQKIKNVLMPFKEKVFNDFELKIALSSAIGYAFYSKQIVSVKEYLEIFG